MPITTARSQGGTIGIFGIDRMRKGRGFTLVEFMVVILIIGILAAVAIPLMQARIDKSKWSEACASAGIVRRAVRAYAAETSVSTSQGLSGSDLSDSATQAALGFRATDLEGTYFSSSDYTITTVNGSGIATITVTGGSKADSPTGIYVLQEDGSWVKQ
jgi:prepilin-type N-terminal cleavage/methylation domain-containing protein